MEIKEYKALLIKHMELKIGATRLLLGINPRLVGQQKGFIDALEVMISFVSEVTDDVMRLAEKKGGK